MRIRECSIIGILISVAVIASAQTHFRSGVFLHHSTGGCIWGPNGSSVSVSDEIAKYNTAHALSGSDSVDMVQTWWPSGDNEWVTWHNIFENNDASNDIQPYLTAYPIVMIKSCFPSANMTGAGSDADTSTPSVKSIANYKWHWRSLVSAMKVRTQNFFVIWTNAPQVAGSTNASEAAFSDAFCRWAKDTLAAGLDPLVGTFPTNIFVFDFFHLLAGTDGMLPLEYASSSSDSHPNAAATALVAPQLVEQVFNAALAYESATAITRSDALVPATAWLDQNYPNPFNPTTVISGQWSVDSRVSLVVYDVLGREVATLADGQFPAGRYSFTFDARGLASGMYFYRLTAGAFTQTRTMILMK